MNQNLKRIEAQLYLKLSVKDGKLSLSSKEAILPRAIKSIEQLIAMTVDHALSIDEIDSVLNAPNQEDLENFNAQTVKLKKKFIRPKTELQSQYMESISKKVINFGVGPAGTGKTYLAVAKAVQALENEEVARLILTRPAVEAGEKLGFLPGDLSQKVDPYLRPVYDALYEMLGFEKVEKLISRHIIEVAPLAYMRGRTLNNAFVILDEAQNTTPMQMKMFLTRIGFGTKAVVTGDITQIDLPANQSSGLSHSLNILKKIEAIGIVNFTSGDVVRHPLVQNIVEAYDEYEK
ncbi:MAG: phosphate starvation-inducible PhoH-like protein [Candidatus Azotimanducaceae bacterium]